MMRQIKTICAGCGMEIPDYQKRLNTEFTVNDPTVEDVQVELCWLCVCHAVARYYVSRERPLRTRCDVCKGTGMVMLTKQKCEVKCERCYW